MTVCPICRRSVDPDQAWSFGARRRQVRLPGCTHKTCNNCLHWALTWRDQVLDAIGSREVQGVLC